MKEILIYTTSQCRYCMKAKQLLERKGFPYKDIAIDGDRALMREVIQKSGGMRTVPQIFIGDQHIGGCDDLYELDHKGELDPMVQS